MTARSILEIDVHDQAFRDFQELFAKYQSAVAGMPGKWGKVGEAADGAAAGFEAMLAGVASIAAGTAALVAGQEKFGRAVAGSERGMGALARSTGKVAHDVKEATLSLIKWTGIVGAVDGLLGAGGLWGIERLAGQAGGARREALGLGVASGDQQSFAINYGRFVDPRGLLSSVADAQSDLGAWQFHALGIDNPRDKNTADLAAEVTRRARDLYMHSDRSQQFVQAHGIDRFVSMEDLRRLAATPDKELDDAEKNRRQDRQTLAVDANTQRKWQDFTQQLSRAGTEIDNVLIRGLVGLADPLSHLSKGVADLIAALLSSPDLKKWIDGAGVGLEHLAAYIGTPAFRQDVTDFVAFVGRMARALGSAVGWIERQFGVGTPATPQAPDNTGLPAPAVIGNLDHGGQNAWLAQHGVDIPTRDKITGTKFEVGGLGWNDRPQIAHDYFRSQGWSEQQTAGILANFEAESGWDLAAVNKKSGAQGLPQWLGVRKDRFRRIFGRDPKDAPLDEQLMFVEWELEHTHKKVGDDLRNETTDIGSARVFLQEYEAPENKDDPHEISRRESLAQKESVSVQPYNPPPQPPIRVIVQHAPQPPVKVQVQNNTGGSAVVTASQVAQ